MQPSKSPARSRNSPGQKKAILVPRGSFCCPGISLRRADTDASEPGMCAQVTAAIAMQLATLNTNARYLHEGLVSYAEALTATFPDELSVRTFP